MNHRKGKFLFPSRAGERQQPQSYQGSLRVAITDVGWDGRGQNEDRADDLSPAGTRIKRENTRGHRDSGLRPFYRCNSKNDVSKRHVGIVWKYQIVSIWNISRVIKCKWMIDNYYWCDKFEIHTKMPITERIHWAKQGLNPCNREEAISNRKMVKFPTLPIYKEFESIEFIFIASVLMWIQK